MKNERIIEKCNNVLLELSKDLEIVDNLIINLGTELKNKERKVTIKTQFDSICLNNNLIEELYNYYLNKRKEIETEVLRIQDYKKNYLEDENKE